MDKRTKEYKEWKRSQGLGDTIEKITEATGIKQFTKWLVGDCGCEGRKKFLNEAVSYVVPCMEKSEADFFEGYLKRHGNETILKNDIFQLNRMTLRLFKRKLKTCANCPGAAKNNKNNIDEAVYNLNIVYESYLKNKDEKI